MTYLAVQISLYLASAALIGLFLGWIFWGLSYHRRIAQFHDEMTASLEEERNRSDELRHELDIADAKLNKRLDAEKADAAKTLVEVQGLLDGEKEANRVVKADMEKLRLEMGTAIDAEKASAAMAIEEATQHADSLKNSIEEAKARETKIQAELEELRLMAGAEKLAAQSARAEIEQLRREMQLSLDAERETSKAAREALDDIRATLTRTFGENAGIIAALETQPKKPTEVNAAISSDMTEEVDDTGNEDQAGAIDDLPDGDDSVEVLRASGIDAEPGTAFDVPDENATDADQSDQRMHRRQKSTPTIAKQQKMKRLWMISIISRIIWTKTHSAIPTGMSSRWSSTASPRLDRKARPDRRHFFMSGPARWTTCRKSAASIPRPKSS